MKTGAAVVNFGSNGGVRVTGADLYGKDRRKFTSSIELEEMPPCPVVAMAELQAIYKEHKGVSCDVHVTFSRLSIIHDTVCSVAPAQFMPPNAPLALPEVGPMPKRAVMAAEAITT